MMAVNSFSGESIIRVIHLEYVTIHLAVQSVILYFTLCCHVQVCVIISGVNCNYVGTSCNNSKNRSVSVKNVKASYCISGIMSF